MDGEELKFPFNLNANSHIQQVATVLHSSGEPSDYKPSLWFETRMFSSILVCSGKGWLCLKLLSGTLKGKFAGSFVPGNLITNHCKHYTHLCAHCLSLNVLPGQLCYCLLFVLNDVVFPDHKLFRPSVSPAVSTHLSPQLVSQSFSSWNSPRSSDFRYFAFPVTAKLLTCTSCLCSSVILGEFRVGKKVPFFMMVIYKCDHIEIGKPSFRSE